MKASFIIDENYRKGTYTTIPFEIVKSEWKRQIGNKTADGDVVLEVNEINESQIQVVIEVLNPKIKAMLGGECVPVSFSIH